MLVQKQAAPVRTWCCLFSFSLKKVFEVNSGKQWNAKREKGGAIPLGQGKIALTDEVHSDDEVAANS